MHKDITRKNAPTVVDITPFNAITAKACDPHVIEALVSTQRIGQPAQQRRDRILNGDAARPNPVSKVPRL
jgi:hypothetical protein